MRLALLLLAPGVLAGTVFTMTTGGQTVVETVSVDQWDETWTIAISTLDAAGPSTTTTTTTSTTSATTHAAAMVTHLVSAGTIDAYASYQASVLRASLALESAEIKAALASATASAGARIQAGGAAVACCMVLAVAAGALVLVI
ncbi:hypothetical protein Q5752_001268 [Cryptotrichosporon argae]